MANNGMAGEKTAASDSNAVGVAVENAGKAGGWLDRARHALWLHCERRPLTFDQP